MADETGNGAAKKETVKAKLHAVVGRLFHNGKWIKKGSTIRLTPEEAKPLGKAVIPLNDSEAAK